MFRTAKGLGWVEPGYFDDFPPSRPQWHELDGEVVDTENGVALQSAERILLLALDAERVRGQYRELEENFAYLAARLSELRTTLADQRLKLSGQVGAIE